jgi:hypothetical protein
LFDRIDRAIAKLRRLLPDPDPPSVKRPVLPCLWGCALYKQSRQLRQEATRLCAYSKTLLAAPRCPNGRKNGFQGSADLYGRLGD